MNNKQTRRKSKAKMGVQIRFARSIVALVMGVAFLSGVAVFASKGGGNLFSFSRPSVIVNLSGVVNRENGKVDLAKAGAVKPGEILEWNIVSENDGDGKANGYKTVGQIPSGTEFVAGSANAKGLSVVKFSIDAGQNFSEQPMIKEKQSDGSEKLVPAPAKMYTQVRFEWKESLDPGQKLNAFYSVRVK